MKLNDLIKNFRFVLGFIVLIFSVGCSSKILSENQTNISPTPSNTSENCEMFAGRWQSNMFEEAEDEIRMICDGKPCLAHNRGGAGFRLTCNNGKITGVVILSQNTYGMVSNIAVPNKTPVFLEETTAPLKESKVENGVLYLSYISDDAADVDCLKEIIVKQKGNLLVGTYKNSNCEDKGLGLSNRVEQLKRMKTAGGVVLEKW